MKQVGGQLQLPKNISEALKFDKMLKAIFWQFVATQNVHTNTNSKGDEITVVVPVQSLHEKVDSKAIGAQDLLRYFQNHHEPERYNVFFTPRGFAMVTTWLHSSPAKEAHRLQKHVARGKRSFQFENVIHATDIALPQPHTVACSASDIPVAKRARSSVAIADMKVTAGAVPPDESDDQNNVASILCVHCGGVNNLAVSTVTAGV